MSPSVSIIIPCYNQGHFLRDAVQSALSQTWRPVEILVVNDGSTDCTSDVVATFGTAVKLIEKRNGGLSSARNAGLREATGNFVVFLDADDLLHPKCLEAGMEAIAGQTETAALVGSEKFKTDPSVDGFERILHENTCQFFPTVLIPGVPVHSIICPRSVIDTTGDFDESLTSHEDFDFWIRIGLKGTHLKCAPMVGAFYRQHSNSMSRNRLRMLETRADVLLRHHRSFVENSRALRAGGESLLMLEHLTLRKFMGRGTRSIRTSELAECIEELQLQGVKLTRSWAGRLAERFLGRSTDKVALMVDKYFRPTKFKQFCEIDID